MLHSKIYKIITMNKIYAFALAGVLELSSCSDFYPDRMASRILDLGDFKTLIENVQGAIDEEEAREMAKKMAKTISPWMISNR